MFQGLNTSARESATEHTNNVKSSYFSNYATFASSPSSGAAQEKGKSIFNYYGQSIENITYPM